MLGITEDAVRWAMERLPSAQYLAGYYQRWLAALERLVVDKGALAPGELDAHLAGENPTVRGHARPGALRRALTRLFVRTVAYDLRFRNSARANAGSTAADLTLMRESKTFRDVSQAYYKTRGYYDVKVVASGTPEDCINGRVPVDITISAGPVYHFDGVTVSGLDRLRPVMSPNVSPSWRERPIARKRSTSDSARSCAPDFLMFFKSNQSCGWTSSAARYFRRGSQKQGIRFFDRLRHFRRRHRWRAMARSRSFRLWPAAHHIGGGLTTQLSRRNSV